jgi:CheY-like chemotaxis protein
MSEYTILIVDYDPRTLESLREIFESLGHSVEMSTDGVDAIEAFDRVRPDLTLIEFMLPKRSGLEVCLELRGTPHGESAPILIMSSRFRSRQYRSEARHRYKANDFLEKPIDEEKVVAMLQRYVAEQVRTEVVVDTSESDARPASSPPDAELAAPETDPALHDEITERIDALLGGDL